MMNLLTQVDTLKQQLSLAQQQVEEAEKERDDVLIYLTQLSSQNEVYKQQLGLGAAVASDKENDIT